MRNVAFCIAACLALLSACIPCVFSVLLRPWTVRRSSCFRNMPLGSVPGVSRIIISGLFYINLRLLYTYYLFFCIFAAMKGTIIKITAMALVAVALLSCGGRRGGDAVRSVYYWSTTLRMDSVKEQFMREHNVSRMYIRYFDVVEDESGRPVPNATLRFVTAVPKGIEVVPVVYIVNSCMRRDISGLAEKIYRRVRQMNETNSIGGVKEIQTDCDWTMRTRDVYYDFLKQLRSMAAADGIKLSATIRLHQLSQPAPPVDRGVLMMYNTGDFTDLECSKPILDMDDAAPYMSRLASYNLPLASAYPLFSWRILFRGSRYVGIMHADDDLPVLAGDSIVERRVELDDIMRAKDAVSRKRADANGEILLFDMSNQNITRFKPEDYEKIYLR